MATDFMAKIGYMRSFGRAVLCKYDGNQSSNLNEGKNAQFWIRRQKSAYLTDYWTELHQRFSIGMAITKLT